MIAIVSGNIIEAKTEAIVNTVNTLGVMGKGIALQFKQAYPEMFKEYQLACKNGQVMIGKMHVWKSGSMFGPKYIINFPTKEDWRRPSKIEYIEKGLTDLVRNINDLNIGSIAIPPLGCGNGGLNWKEVKPLIIQTLKPLEHVHVELYEPTGAPETIIRTKTDDKKMTAARALVLRLFRQYCVLGYELTLLEVQKLCFFLQEFGEPLKLRFTKHTYGPYADNVRHVLINFEGIYTQGFVDGSNNTPENTIRLLPRAIDESESFINEKKSEIGESLQRLYAVEKFIEGYETPFGMELLSSVWWIAVHEKIPTTDPEKIIQALHNWNPRKAKIMKPEFIMKAIRRVAGFQHAH